MRASAEADLLKVLKTELNCLPLGFSCFLRFASACVMGTVLSVLSSLRCDTASELEELQQIQDVFRKPKGKEMES